MDTVKIRRPWSVTKRKCLFVSCSVLRPQKGVSDQPPLVMVSQCTELCWRMLSLLHLLRECWCVSDLVHYIIVRKLLDSVYSELPVFIHW